jgi:hypothetical protein
MLQGRQICNLRKLFGVSGCHGSTFYLDIDASIDVLTSGYLEEALLLQLISCLHGVLEEWRDVSYHIHPSKDAEK